MIGAIQNSQSWEIAQPPANSAGPVERAANRDRAQLGRGEARELALESALRRACGGDNYDVILGHRCTIISWVGAITAESGGSLAATDPLAAAGPTAAAPRLPPPPRRT